MRRILTFEWLRYDRGIIGISDIISRRFSLFWYASSKKNLKVIQRWCNCNQKIIVIRSAVLYYKSCSAVKPDYYVKYLENNPLIHQPVEGYEQIHPKI
jgi:hypothetical protein